MPVAAVTGAVGLYSAHQQSSAAHDAADVGREASEAAIEEARRAREEMRGDLAPYTGAGNNALAALGRVNAGDYSGFENSPDYLYARDQAQYAIDHGAAAAGDLYSGGHSLDLGREIAGIASQNFGSYRNNLMELAGLGENAAAQTGNAGMTSAGMIGGYLGAGANAAARGYRDAADINSNLAAGLGGAAVNWWNARPSAGATEYGGGSNAGTFGLPAPVDPYANANFGHDDLDWGY